MEPQAPVTPTVDHHKNFFIAIFSILALIFGIIIVILAMNMRGNKGTAVKTMNTVPTHEVKTLPKGVIRIVRDEKTPVNVNSAFTANVSMDSDNQLLAGYDVIVTYDATQLSYISFSNVNTNYNVIKVDNSPDAKAGTLIFSGSKKLDGTITALNNTPMLNLMFRPLKQGETAISAEYKAFDKTDSNLVTDNNEDILGSVENLKIIVQ